MPGQKLVENQEGVVLLMTNQDGNTLTSWPLSERRVVVWLCKTESAFTTSRLMCRLWRSSESISSFCTSMDPGISSVESVSAETRRSMLAWEWRWVRFLHAVKIVLFDFSKQRANRCWKSILNLNVYPLHARKINFLMQRILPSNWWTITIVFHIYIYICINWLSFCIYIYIQYRLVTWWMWQQSLALSNILRALCSSCGTNSLKPHGKSSRW